MRSTALVFASLFIAAIGSFASTAHAQSSSIEQCTGNFEEAQLKEKRGKLIDAELLYAACADTKCPAMIRNDCSAKRDEMNRRIPTITVVVRDPSGNDLKAYVEIDGHPVTDRAHAQPIDPGDHLVNYRAEGKKPATQKITVVEGEKARVINITAREGNEPAVPSTEPAKPSPQPSQPTQESQGGGSIVAPVIVGSIGTLALIAGVGLQILALNEDRKAKDLADDLNRARSDGDSQGNVAEIDNARSSRQEAAERNQLLAIIVGAGGLVCIGGSVVLYFVTRPSPKQTSFFTPVVSPGFAGASYGLRF